MSTVLLTILRIALSVAASMIAKIPPEEWAKLGAIIAAWLTKLVNNVPAGSPAIRHLAAFNGKAPGPDKLA